MTEEEPQIAGLNKRAGVEHPRTAFTAIADGSPAIAPRAFHGGVTPPGNHHSLEQVGTCEAAIPHHLKHGALWKKKATTFTT
jgi:hypothetical protein